MDKTRISKLYTDNRDIVMIDFDRPLPNPPSGYYWSKNEEDKSWILKQFDPTTANDDSTVENQTTFEQGAVIEHIILPADTIQGICLRYRVSATELRRWNHFSGSTIKHLSSLKIPVDHNHSVLIQSHDTPDVLLQRFKTRTHDSTNESLFYLSENDWNLENALKHWQEDQGWDDTVEHVANFGDFVPEDEADDEEGNEQKQGGESPPRRRGWTVPGIKSMRMRMGMGSRGSRAGGVKGTGGERSPAPVEEAKDASLTLTPERGETRSSASATSPLGSDGTGGDSENEQNSRTSRRHSDGGPVPLSAVTSNTNSNNNDGSSSSSRSSSSSSVRDLSKSIFSFFQRKRSFSSAGGGGTGSVQPSKDAYADPFREPLIEGGYAGGSFTPPLPSDYPLKQLS